MKQVYGCYLSSLEETRWFATPKERDEFGQASGENWQPYDAPGHITEDGDVRLTLVTTKRHK